MNLMGINTLKIGMNILYEVIALIFRMLFNKENKYWINKCLYMKTRIYSPNIYTRGSPKPCLRDTDAGSRYGRSPIPDDRAPRRSPSTRWVSGYIACQSRLEYRKFFIHTVAAWNTAGLLQIAIAPFVQCIRAMQSWFLVMSRMTYSLIICSS